MKKKILVAMLALAVSVSAPLGGVVINNVSTECQAADITWQTGFVTGNGVRVRTEPNLNCSIITNLYVNTEIQYSDYSTDWKKIKYNGKVYYISAKYVSEKSVNAATVKTTDSYKTISAPSNSGFKSYMYSNAITSKSSIQYKLKQYSYVGTYGIMQIDGRYSVALGTGWGAKVGDYFDLVLANGTTIPCIVGDIKADRDTQSNNIITKYNGCLSEFIVSKSLDSSARKMGDVSYCNKSWRSKTVAIRLYNKNYFGK